MSSSIATVPSFGKGRVLRSGIFSPTSTVVSVELGSVDVPFVFEEISADFQDVTIQGQLAYRVVDPTKLIKLLNYTVDGHGRYTTDDPEKLDERLIQLVQNRSHKFVQTETLQSLLLRVTSLRRNCCMRCDCPRWLRCMASKYCR